MSLYLKGWVGATKLRPPTFCGEREHGASVKVERWKVLKNNESSHSVYISLILFWQQFSTRSRPKFLNLHRGTFVYHTSCERPSDAQYCKLLPEKLIWPFYSQLETLKWSDLRGLSLFKTTWTLSIKTINKTDAFNVWRLKCLLLKTSFGRT